MVTPGMGFVGAFHHHPRVAGGTKEQPLPRSGPSTEPGVGSDSSWTDPSCHLPMHKPWPWDILATPCPALCQPICLQSLMKGNISFRFYCFLGRGVRVEAKAGCALQHSVLSPSLGRALRPHAQGLLPPPCSQPAPSPGTFPQCTSPNPFSISQQPQCPFPTLPPTPLLSLHSQFS